MKTKILYTLTLVVFLQISHGQVGVGTTDPKASLDVASSSLTSPSNTDGILIPQMDNFPTANPSADQDGMMVFATGNGVPLKGFYYWDNDTTSWVSVRGSDSDFYEIGTTTPPDAIIDDIYTLGKLKIGQNSPANASLSVHDWNSSNFSAVNISRSLNTASTSGQFNGFYTSLDAQTSDNYFGVQSILSGNIQSQSANYYALASGSLDGFTNLFSGSFYSASGTGRLYGVHVGFMSTVTNTGNKYGFNVDIPSSLPGTHYGLYSNVQNSSGYAAYLIGRTSLGHTTANRYIMPSVDGSTGQVMTTDGFGNISFETPVSGPERINDLLDAKSDNDGSDDGSSLFLGIDAGANDDSTHNYNVGIGFQALQSNISSWGNTAIGHQAMQASTSGMNNTATGAFSLTNNNSGVDNAAFGNAALGTNTIGSFNSAIGYASLNSNTNGIYNTALGYWTLLNNVSGSRNVALGSSSGYTNTNGSDNVFIGYQSGYFETGSEKLYIENSNGDSNNALIYGEFDTNILRTNGEFQIGNPLTTGYAFPTSDGTNGQVMTTDGSGNITFQNIVGDGTGNDWSLSGNSSNSLNFLGTTNNLDLTIRTNNTEFLKVTTTGQLEFLNTSESIKIGQYAGEGTGGIGISRNVFIGHEAARFQGSTSLDNIGIGHEALRSVTGSSNIAIGSNTLRDTNSNNNIAIGNSTLWKNDTGSTNTALGYVSLGENTTGSNNTAIGALAGRINVSGNNNTYLGNRSGYFSTGSSNVFIGYNSGSNELGDHKLYIANSNADADNALLYGEFDNAILRTNGALQIGNPSLNGYSFPNVDGTSGQVMTTDGAGNVTFQDNNSDVDFYEFGTTNVPDDINDDKVTLGTLTIGGNLAPNATMTILDTDGSKISGIRSYRTFTNASSTWKRGITSYMESNATNSDELIGYYSQLEGSTNNYAFNYYALNNTSASGNSTLYQGDYLSTSGTGNLFGSQINYGSGVTNTGDKWGYRTSIPSSLSGVHRGIVSDVQKANSFSGVFIGRVSIGNDPSANRYILPIADGTNGQVMTTDGSGNTSWQNLPSASLSLARITMSANQSFTTSSWQKLNFDTVDFDLNSEFNTTTDEFEVNTTGYYRINASWRSTNTTTSTNAFGIAIVVNGVFEGAVNFNNSGSGYVFRSINRILVLNAGDSVEIQILNTGPIDVFSNDIVTSFELEQIR